MIRSRIQKIKINIYDLYNNVLTAYLVKLKSGNSVKEEINSIKVDIIDIKKDINNKLGEIFDLLNKNKGLIMVRI